MEEREPLVGETPEEVVACFDENAETWKDMKYPNLLAFLKSRDMEIPEDLLVKKDPNQQRERDLLFTWQKMKRLFEKHSAGFKVLDCSPYMSFEYPYCRWIVKYEISYSRHFSYLHLDELFRICKPPQVTLLTFKLREMYQQFNGVVLFGSKNCACVEPTKRFVTDFNSQMDIYNLFRINVENYHVID